MILACCPGRRNRPCQGVIYYLPGVACQALLFFSRSVVASCRPFALPLLLCLYAACIFCSMQVSMYVQPLTSAIIYNPSMLHIPWVFKCRFLSFQSAAPHTSAFMCFSQQTDGASLPQTNQMPVPSRLQYRNTHYLDCRSLCQYAM